VSFVTFLLFPAEMTRPTAESAGAWAGAFRWLYGIDGPANTFPSLHVAVTTLAWARARRWRNGWMWTLWGGAVILSKLTTKQHFVADVVAGSLVALAADAWAGRESRVLVPSGG
jgi:membrane-associated phospholipid phosphatase